MRQIKSIFDEIPVTEEGKKIYIASAERQIKEYESKIKKIVKLLKAAKGEKE